MLHFLMETWQRTNALISQIQFAQLLQCFIFASSYQNRPLRILSNKVMAFMLGFDSRIALHHLLRYLM